MSTTRMEENISLGKINEKREFTNQEKEMIDSWIKLNGKPIRKELAPEIEKLFKKKDYLCVKTMT